MGDVNNVILTGRNGALDGSSPTEVAALVARLRTSQEVAVHLHGGLVSKEAGIATAKRLTPVYEAAGAQPVFIVWQSGLSEVVERNLPRIMGEGLFLGLLKRITQFAVGKLWQDDDSRAAGSLPIPKDIEVRGELSKVKFDDEPYRKLEGSPDLTELSQPERQALEAVLTNDQELAEALAQVLAARHPITAADQSREPVVVREASSASLIDPDVLEEIDPTGIPAEERGLISTALLAKKGGAVLLRTINRFRKGNDHGLYPTVVEEILREFYLGNAGGSVWSAMKSQTSDAFAQQNRGGRLLLDGLAQAQPSAFPRITVVGHSAGAVFIDNLIAEVARGQSDGYRPWPAAGRFRLALLAPANSYAAFASTLSVATQYIANLRLFTMTDAAERDDRLLGALYPRSLLYFVSGVLERDRSGSSTVTPLTGLSRYLDSTYSRSAELQGPRAFLSGRVVLSPTDDTAPLGRRTQALKHGLFDDDSSTLESVQAMIANSS